ncbi:MAG: hypothetical protein HRT37_18160 [Alteromonadaceae bacterium]|nr:hypothetical protein [Alteromonadaceae bacterium]
MGQKAYIIIFETYDLTDPALILNRSTIMEESLTQPTNLHDFSIDHEKQIELLQISLDNIIAEKVKLLNQNQTACPKCKGQLAKLGKQTSAFYDVFTDHHVKIQRLKCKDCGYEAPATVRNLLNGNLSGALVKIQSELGASETFRDSESLFKTFTAKSRKVNNHNRIKKVTQSVGQTIIDIDQVEKELLNVDEANELIVNVDGGHVKTTEEQRSIEALTSVIYRPEALISNKKGTINHLSEKSCAASVKDDEQKEMINNTIVAALKQGLTPNTHITALCDGATNCWNVVESLRPLCASMTCILDWFHIGMKMQNIALPKAIKNKFLRIKWHLWRGNTDAAIIRLAQLIASVNVLKVKTKLSQFKQYVENNRDRIVNYRERQQKGQVFTSNLAESTVESLINQRCKGQQHMLWSREGLNPILQLRAKIHSKDWDNKWKMVILNSPL